VIGFSNEGKGGINFPLVVEEKGRNWVEKIRLWPQVHGHREGRRDNTPLAREVPLPFQMCCHAGERGKKKV